MRFLSWMKYHFKCSVLLLLGLLSCRDIADMVLKPSAREVYQREFETDSFRFVAWQNAFEQSLADSLIVELPFSAGGFFVPGDFTVYSYNVELKQGQNFHLEVDTDTTDVRVFIDFFEMGSSTSGETFEVNARKDSEGGVFQYEVNKSTTYKVVVQSEIEASTPFIIIAYTSPTLAFPVAGRGNKDILSFWGAPRDGGRRTHEGIDVFAPRGTPVVASADGRITYVGERGLGGKQVWLRTGVFGGYSLYYAHLDSITVGIAQGVKQGDTLGFVGNTGNAITTSPHLHFGIYKSMGAVDPLSYVYQSEKPTESDFRSAWKDQLVVRSSVANLRQAASLNGPKIGTAQRGDTLHVRAITEAWWHIQTADHFEAFIHQSTVH